MAFSIDGTFELYKSANGSITRVNYASLGENRHK